MAAYSWSRVTWQFPIGSKFSATDYMTAILLRGFSTKQISQSTPLFNRASGDTL